MDVVESIAVYDETYTLRRAVNLDTEFVLNLTDEAARLGNNVGLDEYDGEKVAGLLPVSEIYTINLEGKTVGLIILLPCPYSRRLLPLVGYFHIILSEGSVTTNTALYRHLVELSVKLVIAQDKGYVGVMTSLFTPCVAWYDVLKEQGFNIALMLPSAGKVKKYGRSESYEMYRRFSGQEIKGKQSTVDDVIARAHELCADLPEPEEDTAPLPQLPFLQRPLLYTGGDVTCVVRNLEKRDVLLIYKHLRFAIDAGYGYGESQFSTYKYFYHTRIRKMDWCVLELLEGTMICAMGRERCFQTRSTTSRFSHGMLTANPAMLGTGSAMLFSKLTKAIEVMCSLFREDEGWIDNAFLTNLPILKIASDMGYVRIGYIPASDIINGEITDCICYHVPSIDKSYKDYFTSHTQVYEKRENKL